MERRYTFGLSVAHKNVRGKFKALAQFSYLLQSELALPPEEHGDCTLRSEFLHKFALCDVLMFQKEADDGNCVNLRNRIGRFLVSLDQKRQKLDGLLLRTGRILQGGQSEQGLCVCF